MPIAWDDGPATGPPPSAPVHNVRNRSTLLLLGSTTGVFVHWSEALRRTLPCTGGKCPHCAAGQPSRWAGYVPAHRSGRTADGSHQWQPVVWYFPENVRRQVLDLGELRGLIVGVEKLPEPAAVSLKLTAHERKTEALVPAAFDVKAALMKVWRYGEGVKLLTAVEVPDAELTAGEITAKNRRRRKGGAA